MNTVNLIGRLTKDPEEATIKSKDGDLLKVSFTLAVDRNKDEADFIRCYAFGKTAETIADYTGKGVRIGVTGHIRTGSYEDKETKKTVFTTDVIVDRFDFADAPLDAEEEEPPKQKGRSRARR